MRQAKRMAATGESGNVSARAQNERATQRDAATAAASRMDASQGALLASSGPPVVSGRPGVWSQLRALGEGGRCAGGVANR